MNPKIQKVLQKLEASGFEAYIVGGYVRDHILGLETTDVDICTNALPKEVMRIFGIADSHNYGSVSFTKGEYSFDITTYRCEENYHRRKPQEIKYVDNLITDIKRRDFTINSLCMNVNGTIIDLLNGADDLHHRLIRVIGNPIQKLTDDPLRILRAIRFSIILDFNLDESILKFINYHKDLIRDLSFTRKQEEINRIIASKNAGTGLKLLKELDLLSVLDISYNEEVVIVPDILGIWAQMKYAPEYPFNRSSMTTIKNIREILARGTIDNLDLYNYELYICTVAGEILGKDRRDIAQRYANLPIKNSRELAINSKDILRILSLEPSPKIKIINEDILKQILSNNLANEYQEIRKYLLRKWK